MESRYGAGSQPASYWPCFGVLMVIIRLVMLRPRPSAGDAGVHLSFESAPRLLPLLSGFGFGAGALSGFVWDRRRLLDRPRPRQRDRDAAHQRNRLIPCCGDCLHQWSPPPMRAARISGESPAHIWTHARQRRPTMVLFQGTLPPRLRLLVLLRPRFRHQMAALLSLPPPDWLLAHLERATFVLRAGRTTL
jgi:hypothetical protein